VAHLLSGKNRALSTDRFVDISFQTLPNRAIGLCYYDSVDRCGSGTQQHLRTRRLIGLTWHGHPRTGHPRLLSMYRKFGSQRTRSWPIHAASCLSPDKYGHRFKESSGGSLASAAAWSTMSSDERPPRCAKVAYLLRDMSTDTSSQKRR
jgi:hypothetical protein